MSKPTPPAASEVVEQEQWRTAEWGTRCDECRKEVPPGEKYLAQRVHHPESPFHHRVRHYCERCGQGRQANA